jgi:hypothetical protein
MHGSFSMSLLFSFTNSLVNTVMTQQILVSTNCLYKEHLESRGTFPSLSYRQDSVGHIKHRLAWIRQRNEDLSQVVRCKCILHKYLYKELLPEVIYLLKSIMSW